MLNTTPGYNALRCSPYGDAQRPQMAVPTQSVGTRFICFITRHLKTRNQVFLVSEATKPAFYPRVG